MMMMYDDHTKGWLALDLAYMCHLYAYVCNLISLTLRMYTRLQYTVFFSPCHCLSIFASGGSPSRKTLYFIRFFMETNRV